MNSRDRFEDSLEALLGKLRLAISDREWEKFHTNENLAKSISIEAAELLECYQWNTEPELERVQEELADVLTYCLLLTDKLGLDPIQIVSEKLQKTIEKYPVEKSRGKSTKYDRL
jgi:NTP pyrophosphatase (non-canonical NTP hydrolase)